MKSAEFLRGITKHVTESEVASSEGGTEDMGIFIPPLQQKIELLKKAVGVLNIYSDEGSTTEEEQESEATSQLKDIQRMAGINPVSDESADDEPLES